MSETNKPLITKYRPRGFGEVIGHESILAPLKRALADSTCPHAFLLTGPKGTGKTSIARIIAGELKCELLEIDAASCNGVDAMRNLVEVANHRALSGSGRRLILIDECHTLSKLAWQALLKTLEEPPDFTYFALCTTEPSKVPDTVVSRCYGVSLKRLSVNEMMDLLTVIAECETWTVDDDVMTAIVEVADGSPRQGISLLQAVHDVKSRDEVARIISLQNMGDPGYALCHALLSNKGGWEAVRAALAAIEDNAIEQTLVGVGRYMMAALVKATKEGEAERIWRLLDALTFPAQSWDPKAQLFAAVGRMRWQGGAN